jgi:hypothetical protein
MEDGPAVRVGNPLSWLLLCASCLALAGFLSVPVADAAEPPVAAYSFDAGSGEVAEDLFGSHDGTLEHGAEDPLPQWTEGKFGTAPSTSRAKAANA